LCVAEEAAVNERVAAGLSLFRGSG